MTPLWWMIAAALGSWLLITTMVDARLNPEVLLGMAGPLASVVVTWVVTARTHASSPERVMGVMVTGLAVKMLFFGAYVSIVLRGFSMRPVPFVISFTSYFIALYAMEALFLRRLFAAGPAAS